MANAAQAGASLVWRQSLIVQASELWLPLATPADPSVLRGRTQRTAPRSGRSCLSLMGPCAAAAHRVTLVRAGSTGTSRSWLYRYGSVPMTLMALVGERLQWVWRQSQICDFSFLRVSSSSSPSPSSSALSPSCSLPSSSRSSSPSVVSASSSQAFPYHSSASGAASPVSITERYV